MDHQEDKSIRNNLGTISALIDQESRDRKSTHYLKQKASERIRRKKESRLGMQETYIPSQLSEKAKQNDYKQALEVNQEMNIDD